MEDDGWIQLTPTTPTADILEAEWKARTFRTATRDDLDTGELRQDRWIIRTNIDVVGEYPLAGAPEMMLQDWARWTPNDGPVFWLFYGVEEAAVGVRDHAYTQYFYRFCMNDYVMK